jgi:hypothetical protein
MEIFITNDEANQVVQSWQGTGTKANLSWDGATSSGTAASGSYTLRLTANDYSGNQLATVTGPLLQADVYPNTLALVNLYAHLKAGTTVNGLTTMDVMKEIRKAFKQRGGAYVVISERMSEHKRIRLLVSTWMRTSVRNFVFTPGHGNPSWGARGWTSYVPRHFDWGICRFYADSLGSQTATSPHLPSPFESESVFKNDKVFVVPQMLQGLRYNFVFLDACFQMGGERPDPYVTPGQPGYNFQDITSVDYVWADAFGIGYGPFDPDSGAIIGFNGFGILNEWDNNSPTQWYQFRIKFWQRLGAGATVDQAFNFANNTTDWSGAAAQWKPSNQSPVTQHY